MGRLSLEQNQKRIRSAGKMHCFPNALFASNVDWFSQLVKYIINDNDTAEAQLKQLPLFK
jgi:hypothetical protein